MNPKHTILFLAIILALTSTNAQPVNQFWNEAMQKIAEPLSRPDWIQFKPEAIIEPLTIFVTQKSAFSLGLNDEMKVYRIEKDDLGFTHYRFNQYYKGYRIIFAEFLVHGKNNTTISANGKMLKGFSKSPTVDLTIDNALQLAKNVLPSAKYAWEIPQLEHDKKNREHDPKATYFPTGELVWVPSRYFTGQMNPADYELAYSFDIITAGLRGKTIFVNASNGTIVNQFALEYSCSNAGVTTNFNGPRNINTKHDQFASTFLLWDDCMTAYVHTRRWQQNLVTADEYTSTNNTWTSVSSAATSQWAARRATDYFRIMHGRNGWNNANAGVDIYQDAQFCVDPPACNTTNGNNASFIAGNMMIGNTDNGNVIDDWNTLDLVAHEFAHGVTLSSGALVYSKEPGALNESFSDIFGVTCYAWFRPPTADNWKVGFDRKSLANTLQSIYIRNMANPNDPVPAGNPDPDTYLGAFWINTTQANDPGDFWGVHTNSGVQNFMYFLLVTGGSGLNDNATPYSVTGIGFTDAQRIAYRALTTYLFSNSQYADARNAWVRSATDLFGACSFQAIQTGKAWFAVGLGPPNVDQNICGNYGATPLSSEASGSYFIAPNCNVTISSTGNLVQFGARGIIISPGFNSLNGSNFRAYPSDCYFAAY